MQKWWFRYCKQGSG